MIQSQGIERTTIQLFILNNLMQKITSKTPYYFQKNCQEIITIFKVLDNPTIDLVDLDLFRPFASEVP